MATHPIAVIHDGVVDIPEDLKASPAFRDGARIQLVPMTEEALGASTEAWRAWESLAGSWAHSPVDPNAVLDEERKRELEQEAQWRD